MSARVKILGAGSIGNHLAHACRGLGWEVMLADIDRQALTRTRDEIYPQRYGAWDGAIGLAHPDELAGTAFDVVIVGTPPDTHVALALAELEAAPPRVLLVEKPLCTPALEDCARLAGRATALGTRVLVGYNHTLTANTQLAETWLREDMLGEILTIDATVREHWRGIFQAHPWLRGPHDTYLGFTERGGGALCEHSHGLNIFQHFVRLAGHGRVIEVEAMLDMVQAGGAHYDRLAQLNVRTESGLVGRIVQDVITEPSQKRLRLQGSKGSLEWAVNAEPGVDTVSLWTRGGEQRHERVAKTRPDDFRPEIEHVAELLRDPGLASPIALEAGLETMAVIAAAIEAHRKGRRVTVDYEGLIGWSAPLGSMT